MRITLCKCKCKSHRAFYCPSLCPWVAGLSPWRNKGGTSDTGRRRRNSWPSRNVPTRGKYSPSSLQYFCTYSRGHCVFICYVLWMTSSNPCIYTRWIWAASSTGNAAELQLRLPASFTCNNIQSHSPLPNIHTQTIHAMLNSISISAHICARVDGCTSQCLFVGLKEGGEGSPPPPQKKDVLCFTGAPRRLGDLGSQPNKL